MLRKLVVAGAVAGTAFAVSTAPAAADPFAEPDGTVNCINYFGNQYCSNQTIGDGGLGVILNVDDFDVDVDVETDDIEVVDVGDVEVGDVDVDVETDDVEVQEGAETTESADAEEADDADDATVD